MVLGYMQPMDLVALKPQLIFCRDQGVNIRFTKAEGAYIRKVLADKVVTANLSVEAGVFDKIKEGLKAAFKRGLAALMGALILSQAAFGVQMKNADKFGDELEKIANKAGIEVSVNVSEDTDGNSQKVTFEFETEDGDKNTLVFNSVDGKASVELENKNHDNYDDDDFGDFVQAAEEVVNKMVETHEDKADKGDAGDEGEKDPKTEKELKDLADKFLTDTAEPPDEDTLELVAKQLSFQHSGQVRDSDVVYKTPWAKYLDFDKDTGQFEVKKDWKNIWDQNAKDGTLDKAELVPGLSDLQQKWHSKH